MENILQQQYLWVIGTDLISIIENAEKGGLKIPTPIKKMLLIYSEKTEKEKKS